MKRATFCIVRDSGFRYGGSLKVYEIDDTHIRKVLERFSSPFLFDGSP